MLVWACVNIILGLLNLVVYATGDQLGINLFAAIFCTSLGVVQLYSYQ